MSLTTYPLGLDEELMAEVKRTAEDTGLSMADAMRQGLKRGRPQVREALCAKASILDGVKPFTAAERRAAFGPNAEFDALEHHCAGLPAGPKPDAE
jgi:hypothetical protein